MSEVVRNYYDENAEAEWDRLNHPYSNIEFQSTLHLIDKYFPASGSICDIGCGPGRYSIELLKRGYNVTLFELSQNELNIAKKKIEEVGLKAEGYICEDALNLKILESEKYDCALLMGPMYHVLNRKDRISILRDTKRILKKGGVALIAYLNSWGVLKAGITEFRELFSDIKNIYGYLDEQSFDKNNGFTQAYFSTPVHALEEVKEAGLEVLTYAGVESFLSGIEREICNVSRENSKIYDNLVKVAAESCELPQYRDAAEHLHIVVKKH